MTDKEMIAEAIRKYPIGTIFKSPDDEGNWRKAEPYQGSSKKTFTFQYHDGIVRSHNGMNTNARFIIKGDSEYICSNPAVYKNGKWAPIMGEPNLIEIL